MQIQKKNFASDEYPFLVKTKGKFETCHSITAGIFFLLPTTRPQ